jgi:hypothetical protein
MSNLTAVLRSAAAVLSLASAALMPAVAGAQGAEALSGTWEGTYRYVASSGQRDVPFRLEMNVRGTSVAGRISEVNTFGESNVPTLFANVIGIVEGRRLRVIKTYDGTGGSSHSVYYEGTLDGSGRSIEGTWTISDRWTGGFRMTRR